ncbi:MAG: hypothetical protein IKM20_01090 [Erysipelotrichales bacterium]|nr:hypothetical protein [Erysipelotrichales bacterium]
MILLYIFVLGIYSIFYFAIIPLFFDSLINGYSVVETAIYFGILAFVTIHMSIMFKGLNKTSKKLKEKRMERRTQRVSANAKREEYFSKHYQDRVRNTSIENLRQGRVNDDCCGIEHEIPYGQRHCPFCGEKVRNEDAICPACQHDI